MGVTSVILVAGGLALLGALLLWRGWRGRRLGDHPHCRRCGFNLYGKPAEMQVCSECGTDITIPRAIVKGVRQRRPGMIATGVVMLVPTLMLLLTIVTGILAGVDWNKRKPAWWLTREAVSVDGQTRDAALTELLTRYGAGKLIGKELDAAIDAGLKYQGQADRPWSIGWGDLIEAAYGKGQVSEEQWKKYATQGAVGSLTLKMREKLRVGDPISYQLTRTGDRVGSNPKLYKVTRISGLVIDGNELSASTVRNYTTAQMSAKTRGSQSGTFDDPVNLTDQLEPGTHAGYMSVKVNVTKGAPRNTYARVTPPPPPNTTNPAAVQAWMNARRTSSIANLPPEVQLGEVELKLPVKFELVKRDESVVRKIDDEKFRRGVEESLSVDRLPQLGGRFDGQLSCAGAPVDLSFKVLVRDGEKEWDAGTVAFRQGESGRKQVINRISSDGTSPKGVTVDLVLRPDPTAAMRSLDINSYWGGEVVIKDVPLDNPFRAVADGAVPLNSRITDAGEVVTTFTYPRARTVAPGETANGVLLTIKTLPTKDGELVAGAEPIQTRELLIFPNQPFRDRTIADGKTTRISGTLKPGFDARHFNLQIEIAISVAGRSEHSFNRNISDMTYDKPRAVGTAGATGINATLSLPK